jgi:DNA helicase-2/ATP-dependent DNA helicase PcrA
MSTTDAFTEAYKKLNSAQKEAVEALEGPVMVVAGPGTGKTQVLALRIANILKSTDTPASGVLCLTFTNAGVAAMRQRLFSLIGSAAGNVRITTFHAFAINLVEQHYEQLDFMMAPQLLDERGAVILVDELLESEEWEYLRPRGNAAMYFNDLKSLISLLKRERLTPQDFLREVDEGIVILTTSPDSISTRGESKGELKKEVVKKIESLERTKEVVRFYELYETTKRTRGLMDYDDVLEYAVTLAQTSEDVCATLRENYLYVLVDEHQDSSGIQNAFLKAVWQETEKPNIFVVGDDRQLIYGFGGASLEYFQDFKTAFGKAKLITLIENYRSTQKILDTADALLTSSLASGKLKSNHGEAHDITLAEYEYPRDEILAAGLAMRKYIEAGGEANECAVLVPKNKHVRAAVSVLRDMGLPVRADESISFFDVHETAWFRRVLSIVADPYDAHALGMSLFDPIAQIPTIEAHRFLHEKRFKGLSLEDLVQPRMTDLFAGIDPIAQWGKTLTDLINSHTTTDIYSLIQKIGDELFLRTATDHETLVRRVEIIRTFLHLVLISHERDASLTLRGFLEYLDRLESYHTHIPVAVLSGVSGVRVMTLHSSKGLEFDFVWIAHMNEKTIMSGKRMGFSLPESVEERMHTKDEAVVKREIYVAITRAKRFCTLSYAANGYTGGDQELAHVLLDIPETHFVRKTVDVTRAELETENIRLLVTKQKKIQDENEFAKLVTSVTEGYPKLKVSVTLLNNFFECPWKWYFRNYLQLPEPKTESLIFGTVVHAGVELLLNAPKKPTEKQVEARFEQALDEETVIDAKLRARIFKQAKAVLADFATEYLPTIEKRRETERSISVHDKTFPHLTMYGKIDLTERFPDGTARVVDFKTGSAKTKATIEKEDAEGRLSGYLRQLVMYSYLIEHSEKNTEVIESQLLYLEADPKSKDAVYRTRIGTEQIDSLKNDIKDYDMFVKSGDWVNRTCTYKPFAGESECPYCAFAETVYGIKNPLA